MENKFEVKNTFRIYDDNILSEMDSTFEYTKEFFKTKNSFLVECIRRGVKSITAEFVKQKSLKSIDDILETMKDHLDSTDKLTTLCMTAFRDIFKSTMINQGLLNTSYKLLLGLDDGRSDVMFDVLEGPLDKLPDGLESAIEDLIKQFGWCHVNA